MCQVTLSIPDESIQALKLSPDQVGAELRLLAAVKLFEMRRLSSGAAANLAGIPRVAFLQKLGDFGVNTFDLTEEELRHDALLK